MEIAMMKYNYVDDFLQEENIRISESMPTLAELRDKSKEYNPLKDEKWQEFCRLHKLNYRKVYKSAYSKFYNMYLQFCIEGLI